MTYSVVICAYSLDRWPDLAEAIASVQRQTHGEPQIIVVADHNAELRERVQRQFPDITVVANSHRRGLSGARNSGVAEASGDVIAFLDDDAVAAPDWLARILASYADSQVIGVGGRVLPRWDGGRKPRWFPAQFLWVVGCSYLGQPTSITPVRNLIGANMSYRREVFSAVGGFREEIGRIGRKPLGCEETELSIRALQHFPAARVLYDPGATVEHRVPKARQTVRYFLERCYAEGLSKALVTRLVGSTSGLSSERTYTFQTLPRGVAAGLAATLRGDPAGLTRAIAIVTGLGVTTLGYLIGKVKPDAAL